MTDFFDRLPARFSVDLFCFIPTYCSSDKVMLRLACLYRKNNILVNLVESANLNRRYNVTNAIVNREVGQRVRDLRIAYPFTIEEFSEILGITPGYLGLIESGARGITIRHLIMISKMFQVSQEYITTGAVEHQSSFK